MPKSCAAPGCSNYNMMGKKLTFHMFPRDKDRHGKWVQACKWINADGSLWQLGSKFVYLYSEHFLGK